MSLTSRLISEKRVKRRTRVVTVVLMLEYSAMVKFPSAVEGRARKEREKEESSALGRSSVEAVRLLSCKKSRDRYSLIAQLIPGARYEVGK